MPNRPYNEHLGDMDKFIDANQRLVHHVCRRFMSVVNNSMYEYGDLYSIGIIGLIKAYKRFDPRFKVKFSTYGVPMIMGEIQRVVRDTNYGPKFPRSYKEACHKILKAGVASWEPEVISKELDMPMDEVLNGLDYIKYRTTVSLESTSYNNGEDEDITVAENIGYEVDYDSALILKEFLDTLPSKHIDIFRMHASGSTQEVIGKKYGVSQVQVSRILSSIQAKALAYGKERFSSNAV